ncbi:MAG: trypsin-like peptidase domain-containing protein [Cyanobacteria bacterium P01_A01_bin.84]
MQQYVQGLIDPTLDLAALKITAANLTGATIRNTDKLRVGEIVLAVGNTLGDNNAIAINVGHNSSHGSCSFPSHQNGVVSDARR